MKVILLFLLTLFPLNSYSDVGQILNIIAGKDSYLMRNSERISLEVDMPLEEGDIINSSDSFIVLYLYPKTQMSISRGTEIVVKKNLVLKEGSKSFVDSLVELTRGVVRVLVTHDDEVEVKQAVSSGLVNFGVRGTEFEVSTVNEDVDLDVVEGEVEASSPLIMTFVPEIIKSNEGFRFSPKQKRYIRRKFAIKFKDYPKFIRKKDELRQRWENRKDKKILKRKIIKKFRRRQK